MQQTVYIGLGSNLGDRKANIERAVKLLEATPGIGSLRKSELLETEPLGRVEHPKYLNAVAELQTSFDANTLLKRMFEIEDALGRERQEKWGPRTIDLDLLFYGDQVIENKDLIVPHSQLHLRSFVLKGLCELNAEFQHPVLGTTVTESLHRLNGGDFAINPDTPQLISVAGQIGVGKTTLARKLSEKLNAELLLEPYDTNPFLPVVYAGRKELALHSQLYFLFKRAEQLSPDNLENGHIAVMDYIFHKERIYAKALLSTEQLAEYEKLYPACLQIVSKPVLVIYMVDSPQNCLGRIHKRNRPYEQGISTDFLQKLDSEYDELFVNWKGSPVIKVSTSQFDCYRVEDIEYLITQVKAYIVDGSRKNN
jgi:2-amino-4-hydroxy-6-hydroxymethyldihydropteridine diphosphokinase